jgi:hypothetical protein
VRSAGRFAGRGHEGSVAGERKERKRIYTEVTRSTENREKKTQKLKDTPMTKRRLAGRSAKAGELYCMGGKRVIASAQGSVCVNAGTRGLWARQGPER